jgi:hypothetical protein
VRGDAVDREVRRWPPKGKQKYTRNELDDLNRAASHRWSNSGAEPTHGADAKPEKEPKIAMC